MCLFLRLLFFLGSVSLSASVVFRPPLEEGSEVFTFFLKERQPFQIVLSGHNWLYHSCSREVVCFVNQSYSSQEVCFAFEPLATWQGEVVLKFFSQDNDSGNFQLLTILVEPVYENCEADFEVKGQNFSSTAQESSINWMNPDTWKSLSTSKLQTVVKQLSEWGDIKGALALTLELERRGEKVFHCLGELYYQMGDNKRAYFYCKKALKEQATQELLLLSVLLAMLEEDSDFICESLRYWLTSFSPPQERMYLMLFSYLVEHQLWHEAYRWADLYDRFYTQPSSQDKYLYLLATFFESSGEYQNIRMALNLYDKILRAYPLSLYWKNSYDRLLALKSLYLLE